MDSNSSGLRRVMAIATTAVNGEVVVHVACDDGSILRYDPRTGSGEQARWEELTPVPDTAAGVAHRKATYIEAQLPDV